MKNNTFNSALGQSATAGKKKRHAWHFSFKRKDAIIRNIEITVACVIAFIAGAGLYGMFN